MTRTILTAAVLVLAGVAVAQTAPAPTSPPPAPPRAAGPPLALAVEAAQTAIAACLANGYKTTALVADSAGVPVAMLTTDGAAARTQQIAPTKIATARRYGARSGDIADRAKTDAKLAAELAADPAIGTPRRGALLIQAGGRTIGYMAVSGAPGGDKDEACVKAGLDRIATRLP